MPATFALPIVTLSRSSARLARRRSAPRCTWLLAVLLAVGCVPPEPQLQVTPPFDRSGLHIVPSGFYKSGPTIVGLEGTATNVSGRDYRMCALYFDVLNASGEKVADALAGISGLARGQTWRFQALFMNPFATSIKSIAPGRVECD